MPHTASILGTIILVTMLPACTAPKASLQPSDLKIVMDASRDDDLPTVRSVVERDPDGFSRVINQIGSQSESTPLHMAASKGRTEIVQYLVSRGVHVDLQEQNGATPLFEAAGSGHVDTVKALLARGANPNASAQNASVLAIAVTGSQTEVVAALLDAGASPNAHELAGSALFIATYNDDIEIVKLLVGHGATVSRGELQTASGRGYNEVAKILTKAFNDRYHLPVAGQR